MMGNMLESSNAKNELENIEEPNGLYQKQWESVVPYLPRVRSFKRRRSNSLPMKNKAGGRNLPLSNVNNRQRSWRRSDYFYPEMIPEPDYSDESDSEKRYIARKDIVLKIAEQEKEKDQEIEEMTAEQDTRRKPMTPRNGRETRPRQIRPEPAGSDVLVQPKKPPNPYIESTERKNLCKEIKFNQKYRGFNTKSELQMALDRYQVEKMRKIREAEGKTSLEKILEKQAKKIETEEREGSRRPSWIEKLKKDQDDFTSDTRTQEFMRVHAMIRARSSGPSSLASESSSDGVSDNVQGQSQARTPKNSKQRIDRAKVDKTKGGN